MQALRALRQPTRDLQIRQWAHAGPARTYAEGAHAGLEIAWVHRGHVRYTIGRRALDVGPGQGVVVPAAVGHVTAFRGAVEADAMQLDAHRVTQLAQAAGLDRPSDPFVVSAEPIASLLRMLCIEAEHDHAGRELTLDALCDALAIRVLRDEPEPQPVELPIRRAIDFVQSRYSDPIGVDDLARAAAMSRYHFSRQFRAQVGVSPYQFVQRVRVERAAQLLESGASVSHAATSVGFADLSRFARAFRKRMGLSPARYRRAA